MSREILRRTESKTECFQVQLVTYCDLSVFFIVLKYIPQIPLKISIILLKSWTSTRYFSNSTGSHVTNYIVLGCPCSLMGGPIISKIAPKSTQKDQSWRRILKHSVPSSSLGSNCLFPISRRIEGFKVEPCKIIVLDRSWKWRCMLNKGELTLNQAPQG